MDLSSIPDAELASRVAFGDSSALEELYSRYSTAVYSMSLGILSDRSTAEDITQEVFIALWTRAGGFDPERGIFKHWFLHLAHNRVIDELRRRRRVAQRSSDRTPDDAEFAVPSFHDTADEALRMVLFGEAREALQMLPAEQRSALILAYLHGATQQEIAEATGVPLGTVKTRLRLGLMKLRHLMARPAAEEQ